MRPTLGPSVPRRRAQATTEAALVFPLMIVLMLGIIDLGWLTFVQISIHYAVWHGAMQGMRDDTTSAAPCSSKNSTGGPRFITWNLGSAALKRIIANDAYYAGLTTGEITVTFAGTCTTGASPFAGYNYYNLTITVNHTHHYLVPALWNSNATVNVYSQIKTYVVKGLN